MLTLILVLFMSDLSYQYIVTTPSQFKAYKFFPVLADNSTEFKIQATDEVYIALTKGAKVTDPMYEICLGCRRNTQTTLKRSRALPYKVEENLEGIVSGRELRGFWIRWDRDGNIRFGRAGETKPVLVYHDPEPFAIGYFGIGTGVGATGTWDIPSYITTPDKFVAYEFFPVVDRNFVRFRIKATNDLYLSLTTGPEESNPMYEFCIGCWENTKTTLKRSRTVPYKMEVELPGILSGDEFRGFWITWDSNGNIYAGKDGETTPFIVWHDTEPFRIGYFGIGTGLGAKGIWDIEGIETTPETFLTYQFHPLSKNVVHLKIKAGHELLLALTSSPEVSVPMYEICIGGWVNTRTVLKRNRAVPFKVEVELPGILSYKEFRGFWVKWDGKGSIYAGREGENRPFLLWHDSDPFPIKYFGISTGQGSKGIWDLRDGDKGCNVDPVPEQFVIDMCNSSQPSSHNQSNRPEIDEKIEIDQHIVINWGSR